MRAVILERFGSVENLKLSERPVPQPGDGQVLVKTAAGGVNPIDVKTRIGRGAANFASVVPPVILGWDVSGTVVACGANAGDWRPGEEAFGSVGFPGLGRTNAEYVAVAAAHLARKPEAVPHEEAAAGAMAGLTAWQALTRHGRPAARQKVLVHAASGGVGHMAVQIAKRFGAHVTGTSSAANRDFVLSLGADAHIDYRAEPLETWPADFDFILDAAGGETTARSLDLLSPGGALISVLPPKDGAVASRAAEIGRRFHFVLMASSSADMAEVAGLLAEGAVRPRIAHRVALDHLAEAHERLETGRVAGKIVFLP